MSYNLGTAHGKIELDYDGGGAATEADEDIRRVGDSSDDADRKVSRFGESLNKFSSFMGKAAKSAAVGALAISSMVHAVGLVAGALAALAPIAVAAIGTLPGLVAGGIGAMAVLKVSLMGVGEALKAASGDAEQFNAALEKLSPQARAFAVAWRDAGQALKPMQQAMQDALFAGLGPQVTRISNGLNSLRGAAVGVAKQFNLLAKEAANSLQDRQFEDIDTILGGVASFLREINGSIKPLIQGFTSLAAQASNFSGALGEKLGSALLRLGNAMQNFDLEAAFNNAMAVLRPLGDLLSNVGSILKSVFGGLQTDAGGALGIVAELTGKLADFLKTAEGQSALQALGQALATISGAAGQVFLTLLQQLAPVIVALAPGLAELALQVASVLVPALETVGPLLAGLAGFLSDNMDVIGPIVIAFAALAAGMKAYAAVQAVVTAATTAWNIVTAIASGATKVWAATQWLLNAAMTANPVGLIIIAIAALIAIIILIATKTTWFQDLWKVVWTAIKDAAGAVADWFTGTIVPSFIKAWDQLKAVVQAVVDFIIGYFRFWQGVWTAVINAILAVVRTFIAGFKSNLEAVKGVVDRVIGFLTNLRNGIIQRLTEAVNFAKGIPGKLIGALGDLGSKLYNKGREFVRGFINGIGSMVSAAVDKVRSLVNAVTDWLPGSPAKKGPLSGRGWTPFRGAALVEGLAEGMQRSVNLVQRVGVKVATAAAPVLPTAAGVADMVTAGAALPMVRPAAVAAPTGPSVQIDNLTVQLQGIWDMTDPNTSRQIAVRIHEAIERVKGDYR